MVRLWSDALDNLEPRNTFDRVGHVTDLQSRQRLHLAGAIAGFARRPGAQIAIVSAVGVLGVLRDQIRERRFLGASACDHLRRQRARFRMRSPLPRVVNSCSAGVSDHDPSAGDVFARR